jgi:lipid-A-disaccharide synthase
MKILISAGEASGDLYAAELVNALRRRFPEAEFFGCTGPRMRAAGVRTVVDAASLSVVGLAEVLVHIPRIYGEFRRLVEASDRERPAVAILTDSPDFHLRVARRIGAKVPTFQLVAPQAWAWRQGRVRQMRRDLRGLLCIFPFEEPFFRAHGVRAHYIGHPLTRLVRPSQSKHEFFRKHEIDAIRPLITMLPGSRVGEVARHLPAFTAAGEQLSRRANLVLATPAGFSQRAGARFFTERTSRAPIQVIEGETRDAIAHADVALAASGTVTVETALLGTPMVTCYRVNPLSWAFGRRLVRVPFLTMVNLIAGREIVPELMQGGMTGERLAAAVERLLDDSAARETMKRELADVTAKLTTGQDPIERAAEIVAGVVETNR